MTARKNKKRKGVEVVSFGPNDGGLIMRGSGQVRFIRPRNSSAQPGTNGFWLNVLTWLFASNQDGIDRREALTEEFAMDMQARMQEQRRAAWATQAASELAESELEDEALAAAVEIRVAELEAEHVRAETKKLEAQKALIEKARAEAADDMAEEEEARDGEEVSGSPQP